MLTKIPAGLFILLLATLCLNEVTAEENKTEPEIKVSIVPEHWRDSCVIRHSLHFHVLIENISSKPWKFWRGMENDGHSNLSFELVNNKGTKSTVKITPLPPGSEIDTSLVLQPGEQFILEVYPKSLDWSAFPVPSPTGELIKLKAVYQSSIAKKEPIGWTGNVTSSEIEVSYRP